MRTSTREPGIIIEVRTGQSRASRRTHGTKTPPRVDDKRTMYNYRLHRSKIIASPNKHTNTNIRTYWFCLRVRSIIISKFTISIIGDHRLSLFLRSYNPFFYPTFYLILIINENNLVPDELIHHAIEDNQLFRALSQSYKNVGYR